MGKCECEWCTKISPAIAWMKNNAPREHYDALDDALAHKEVVETDAAMYSKVVRERDELQRKLDEMKRIEIARQDDYK